MKEKRVRYYVIIAILIFYFLLMYVFFIYPSMKDKKNNTYLIANKNAKWMYEDGKWKDIEDSNLYNWQHFDIYEKTKFLGNYNLLYNDRWYLFDDNRDPVERDGVDLFAIRTNQKYKYGAFTFENVSSMDMKYVYQVLEENNIRADNFTSMKEFSFDVDGDQQEEKVFVLSNMFTENIASKYVFNFMFTVDNEKINMLVKTIDPFDKMFDNCRIDLSYLVDITGNGTYEFITSCDYYSDRGVCMEMYELKKGKYLKVKSCKSS